MEGVDGGIRSWKEGWMDGGREGEKEGWGCFPSGPPEAALVSITLREESVILTDDIPQHNASSFTSSPSLPLTLHG